MVSYPKGLLDKMLFLFSYIFLSDIKTNQSLK